MDDKWSYTEIPDDWKEYGYTEDQLGIFLDQEHITPIIICSKYRGFNYEIIEYPPVEEIIKRLKRNRNAEIYHREQKERFQKMLDNLGHITKKDFNI